MNTILKKIIFQSIRGLSMLSYYTNIHNITPVVPKGKSTRNVTTFGHFYQFQVKLVKVAGTRWMQTAQDRSVYRTLAEAYVQQSAKPG